MLGQVVSNLEIWKEAEPLFGLGETLHLTLHFHGTTFSISRTFCLVFSY